jgi:hypothetical protein
VKRPCPSSGPYSPKFVEGKFSEVGLPLYGVLRSSPHARNAQATAKIVQLGDAPISFGSYAATVAQIKPRVKAQDRYLLLS